MQDGNFSYHVDEHVKGAQFQNLNKVVILGAKELFPNIEKDIKNYVACSMGTTLEAQSMYISYNHAMDTIEIRVTKRKSFQDLTLIKFLDRTKERNICDEKSGFSYTGVLNIAKSTNKQKIYDLHYRATSMKDDY